jgi:hypothetical protein
VTSSVYEIKPMGPRIEPCGTLQSTGYSADALPEKWNVWWRSLSYERSQFNATSCTQKRLARTVRSSLRSTVSKAALRFSSMSDDTWPLSVAHTRSLCTESTADC